MNQICSTWQIAICDDEKSALLKIRKTLSGLLSENGIIASIDSFSSPCDLKEAIMITDYHICFLDISMPEINGIDLAKIILEENPHTLIIFVSLLESIVFQTFCVHPFAFIRKSNLIDDMQLIVDDLIHFFRRKTKPPICVLKDDLGHPHSFFVNEIFYLQANDKYVRFAKKEEDYIIRSSLRSCEEALSEFNFVRCHKSYIVNINKICSVRNRKAILSNHTELPLRRGITTELKNRLA